MLKSIEDYIAIAPETQARFRGLLEAAQQKFGIDPGLAMVKVFPDFTKASLPKEAALVLESLFLPFGPSRGR